MRAAGRVQAAPGVSVRPRRGAVISATLRKPRAATHWSARRLAREVGLSPATVHRIWQKYGLQPHRVETFKFSRDPEFGTTSLFAALEVASGRVHGRYYRRHRHVEFIAFLESLARRYPKLELHVPDATFPSE